MKQIYSQANIIPKKLPSISSRPTTSSTFITDDVGFIQGQLKQIDKELINCLSVRMKPWERCTDNNIYLKHGLSNKNILSKLHEKIKNENLTYKYLDWDKQNYFNQSQLNQIFDGYVITKNVKHNIQSKKAANFRHETRQEFSDNTKKMIVTKLLSNIIIDEKKKLSNLTNSMDRAMEFEKNSIEKDIKKFEDFKLRQRNMLRRGETRILRLTEINKELISLFKKVQLENKSLRDESKRLIKQIVVFKNYGLFLHELMGGGETLKNYEVDMDVNFNTLEESELDDLKTKTFSAFKDILIEGKLDEKTNEMLQSPDNLSIIFDIMELNILKKVSEKEKCQIEHKNIIEKKKIETEIQNQKIKNLTEELKMYKSEIEEIKKRIKFNDSISSKTEELFYLKNLSKFILKHTDYKDKNLLKDNLDKEILISPIITQINALESKVNALISNIEKIEQTDKELAKKVINERKNLNRISYFAKERIAWEKEEDRKKRILIEKVTKIPFIRRRVFQEPIPDNILKQRQKKAPKTRDFGEETNLMFY